MFAHFFMVNVYMIAAPPPLADWQIALVAIPLGLGFWSLVMLIAARVGGWHDLATHYRREETAFRILDGQLEKYRWASLTLGPALFRMNYGNCVTVTLGDEGLGLQVMPLFRPLHPPLLIPWAAIESCTLGQELLIFDIARIQVRGLANPLRIYGRAGRAVDRYWTSREEADASGII